MAEKPRGRTLGELNDEEMTKLGAGLREAFEEIRASGGIELSDEYKTAEKAARAFRRATTSFVSSIRAQQHASPELIRDFDRTIAQFCALLDRVAGDDVEPDDYSGEIGRARVLLAHARTVTSSLAARVAAKAHSITADDLPDALTLLILANPGRGEYWDLARAIQSNIETLDRSIAAHSRSRQVLYAIIHPRDFRAHGDNQIASPPRGAGRASHVESVTPAGLPSLGKRT